MISQSFPIDIASRPELSQMGAWSDKAHYSAKDVQDLVRYAKYRGVRVVPEVRTSMSL